jgi:hypothetical protein
MNKENLIFIRLFYSIFFGVGGVFTLTGIIIGISIDSHIRNSVITPGTVINLVEDIYYENGISEKTYSPIVQYTTNSGEFLIFEDSSQSNPPAYKKGQKVEVIYNPQQLESASIHSRFDSWFLPSIFTGMGVIFIIIGLIPLARKFLIKKSNPLS